MKKTIMVASLAILFNTLVGCASEPTGPQEIFSCSQLSRIVYKGASQKSIEGVFGLGKIVEGKKVKEYWGAYNPGGIGVDSKSRTLEVTYDKNKKVESYLLTRYTIDRKAWPACVKN